jgi:hypothetical protein
MNPNCGTGSTSTPHGVLIISQPLRQGFFALRMVDPMAPNHRQDDHGQAGSQTIIYEMPTVHECMQKQA